MEFGTSMSKIRLSSFEIEAISSIFKLFFGPEDHLWLFGSRTRPEAKGGDIDLYIETKISDAKAANDQKISFLTELCFKIGDQKVDVVLNRIPNLHQLPIYTVAKEEGILLV